MPYLYKTSVETSKTGVPTMRSMVLEFTADKTCQYLDKQYMLGDNLLVAPIFNEDSMAEYYLPQGTWTNFFTGETKQGGIWVNEKHGYTSIPLMVKENSIIALGSQDDKPDYDYADGAEIRFYELKEDVEVSSVIYGMNNKTELTVSALKKNGVVTISTESKKDHSLRLVNVKAVSATGATVSYEGNDTILVPAKGTSSIIVTL